MITIIAVVAVVAFVVFILIPVIYVRNYIKVPPNEVAVFTGRGAPKVVRGGARFRIPGIERVDVMYGPFSAAYPGNTSSEQGKNTMSFGPCP